MIGDVEHLRPELNIENFRDPLDREVFQDRKVKVEEMWSVDAIAADVTCQIGAGARNARDLWGRPMGCHITKRLTLGSNSRRGLRQGVTATVDPERCPWFASREAGVSGITSGNPVQESKLVSPGIPET